MAFTSAISAFGAKGAEWKVIGAGVFRLAAFLEPNGHENIQEQLADIRKSPAIKIALKACDEVAIVIFCFHQCFSQACLEINFSKVAADIIRT